MAGISHRPSSNRGQNLAVEQQRRGALSLLEVEDGIPSRVLDPLIETELEAYLRDNVRATRLTPSGAYEPIEEASDPIDAADAPHEPQTARPPGPR
jgi:2-keto-4-pentenoate hydratase